MENLRSILVVDDLAIWRTKLRDLLEGEGYTVRTAASLSQALAELRKKSFDLVIIDLSLVPGDPANRDGMELAKDAADMGIPAVMLTAYGTPEKAQKALAEYGVFDFLEKQYFTIPKFKTVARRAIAKRPIKTTREKTDKN